MARLTCLLKPTFARALGKQSNSMQPQISRIAQIERNLYYYHLKSAKASQIFRVAFGYQCESVCICGSVFLVAASLRQVICEICGYGCFCWLLGDNKSLSKGSARISAAVAGGASSMARRARLRASVVSPRRARIAAFVHKAGTKLG